MLYEQFVEQVVEVLNAHADENLHLSIHETTKNNGYERKGISFIKKGSKMSPTIYMEEFYHKFLHGSSVERIAEELLEVYHGVRFQTSWNAENIQYYDRIKDKIIYKVVNKEKNKELLSQVPHGEYLDLAILFYVLVELDDTGGNIATMMIRNEHLGWWKVSEDEISRLAALNTEKILPYEFSGMYMVISEMLDQREIDDRDWEELSNHESMYILTNSIRNSGAAAMLYPERLEMIGQYLKENYYILPSSIHEVIILPESKAIPKEELECIVREINEVHIQEEEFLSNTVYYYDREKKEVMM